METTITRRIPRLSTTSPSATGEMRLRLRKTCEPRRTGGPPSVSASRICRLSVPFGPHVVVGNDQSALQALAKLVIVFDRKGLLSGRILLNIHNLVQPCHLLGIVRVDDMLAVDDVVEKDSSPP